MHYLVHMHVCARERMVPPGKTLLYTPTEYVFLSYHNSNVILPQVLTNSKPVAHVSIHHICFVVNQTPESKRRICCCQVLQVVCQSANLLLLESNLTQALLPQPDQHAATLCTGICFQPQCNTFLTVGCCFLCALCHPPPTSLTTAQVYRLLLIHTS